jgi:HlyD family secretion protein
MRHCIHVAAFVAVLALLAGDLAAETPKPQGAEKKAAEKAAAAKTPAAKTLAEEKAAPQATAKPADKIAEKPAAGQAPATHKVVEEPFRIELSLKGVFEAETTREIALRPQAWKTFEVVKAVEPGAKVEKGDVLVELETKDIDEAINDLRTTMRLGELALKQAQDNLRVAEATTPLDLAAAERAKRLADEDLDRYIKINRPLSEKNANVMLQWAEDSLRNEKEELAQLEKMYKADDLTEETEEIVLRRQRDAVRRAEFHLETARVLRDETLAVRIPREDYTSKQGVIRQDLATAKARTALPLALSQQRLELEKMREDRAKAEEKLKKLTADRAAMPIKAPAAGVVYYGQCVRGKWTGADTVAKTLRRGGNVAGNDVFMTIVKPRPMTVRTNVPEKQIRLVRPGLEGTVEPTAHPGKRLPASVSKVEKIPSGDDFEVRLAVELPKSVNLLMPGMSCTVKLVPYRKKAALTVPVAAVFADELDEQKSCVYVVREGGKPKRQKVTVGQRTEERAEILKGLDEGDQVLLDRPKEKP